MFFGDIQHQCHCPNSHYSFFCKCISHSKKKKEKLSCKWLSLHLEVNAQCWEEQEMCFHKVNAFSLWSQITSNEADGKISGSILQMRLVSQFCCFLIHPSIYSLSHSPIYVAICPIHCLACCSKSCHSCLPCSNPGPSRCSQSLNSPYLEYSLVPHPLISPSVFIQAGFAHSLTVCLSRCTFCSCPFPPRLAAR